MDPRCSTTSVSLTRPAGSGYKVGAVRRWVILAALILVAVLPSAASGAALVPLAPSSAWESPPIHATAPAGDSRLFLVERDGGIRIFENSALKKTPFLTVPNVDTSGERGLLSMAFSPDYAKSGLFYVFTVAKEAGEFGASPGDLQVVEFKRSASDPDLADPNSARLVIGIPHSATHHNGGQIAFGLDGFLYITVGDNTTSSNAQDLANLFGKVLRIDPSPGSGVGFGVPPSNPFVGIGGGAQEEIFALGLRNPFRASFAPNGDLLVADVGQDSWEEVNGGNLSGANLGWPICEGMCLSSQPALTDPVFQYANDETPKETTGCAIVGGYVVRDPTLTGLTGRYLYGDFCREDLRTIDLGAADSNPRPAGLSLPEGSKLLSFGEDSRCGVYVMTTETAYRIATSISAPASSPAALCGVVDPTGGSQKQLISLQVKAAKRQKLRGVIRVMAICSESCALRARGALLFFNRGSKAGASRLAPASRSATANAQTRFRLAILKVKVRQRAKRELKHGRQVAARVTVSATDDNGNTVRRSIRIKLFRKRR